ncbi:uncharacterized protein LODBEIA_P26720 [Lodderomyces beijingensis]|uniref:Uncharacterized protein n=1 Tax=Lodderomyces beijingensis TaxID=1775926 RepID=A0ABP0ZLD5_9ASCO
MTSDAISKKVDQLTSLFKSVASEKAKLGIIAYDKQVPLDDAFAKHEQAVRDVLRLEPKAFQFTIDDDAEATPDDQKEAVEQFNANAESKMKEFVISCASQAYFASLIGGSSTHLADKDINFENKIAIALDLLVWIAIKVEECGKSAFYQSLSIISSHLMCISTAKVEEFWSYLETRLSTIRDELFTNKVAERMQILQLANLLVNKYSRTDPSGKTDSYRSDTQNDVFHARVRQFVTQVLDFTDSTGLNKFFHIANRDPHQFITNDNYLNDIIDVQKIFNDPLHYLKKSNSKELARMTKVLRAVLKELLREECRFIRKNPTFDQFAFRELDPESCDRSFLRLKFESKKYVPEAFYESRFKNRSKNEFNESKTKDTKFLFAELESSKVRVRYILEIYFLATLYCSLSPSAKSNFFKEAGVAAGSKHVTDDEVSGSVAKEYDGMRREILAEMKKVDPLMTRLFSSLFEEERFWWRWLLQKDQKAADSSFFEKTLSPEELLAAARKAEEIFPYKSKKSFNKYVTPQISRKMRVAQGLEHLNPMKPFKVDLAVDAIEKLVSTETETKSKADRDAIEEETCSLRWKALRKQRSQNWFTCNSILKVGTGEPSLKRKHEDEQTEADQQDEGSKKPRISPSYE